MGSKADVTKQQYIAWLNELYADIKKWIKKKNLTTQERDFEINEEIPGRYQAPGLSIQGKGGKEIAELRPVGAWIIGASGRVDVIGKLDQIHLVYLEPPGPGINTIVSDVGEVIGKTSRLVFRGVDHSGWYWIEDKRLGRARPITEELFLDLLTEVSDYGI